MNFHSLGWCPWDVGDFAPSWVNNYMCHLFFLFVICCYILLSWTLFLHCVWHHVTDQIKFRTTYWFNNLNNVFNNVYLCTFISLLISIKVHSVFMIVFWLLSLLTGNIIYILITNPVGTGVETSNADVRVQICNIHIYSP